jgi:nanoRNase/pAp phosphatase (c-di-AMP/oligoRNAs hydrolase)
VVRPDLRSSVRQVHQLLEAVQGCSRALILTHNNPDPDAVAGAFCLSRLLQERASLKSRIIYGGGIGRPANRYMVAALKIPMLQADTVKFRKDDAVILVDTQPSFANNCLPEGQPVTAVIDHHEGEDCPGVPLADVRTDYGTVTAILTEYLVSAGVPISRRMATAICFGIKTETQDLGRESTEADIAAYLEAFPDSDQPLLGRLSHASFGLDFLAQLRRAIQSARMAQNIAVCHMGHVEPTDVVSQIADFIVSIDVIDWVMCTGVNNGSLVLSVRTTDPKGSAGELLRRVVGEKSRAGGHDMVAGGALPLEDGADVATIEADLARRFLAALTGGGDVEMRPLLPDEGAQDRAATDATPDAWPKGGEDEGSSHSGARGS